MVKVNCHLCKKKCRGDVLKVGEKYFHKGCFKCTKCSRSLETGGFFMKDEAYYCQEDYGRYFAVRCQVCGGQISGEVISALNFSFHKHCFRCQECGRQFTPGDRVTLWLDRFFCRPCLQRRELRPPQGIVSPTSPTVTDLEATTPAPLSPSILSPNASGPRSLGSGDRNLRLVTDPPGQKMRLIGVTRPALWPPSYRNGVVSDSEAKIKPAAHLPNGSIPEPSPSCSGLSGDESSQTPAEGSKQSKFHLRLGHRPPSFEFGKFFNQSYIRLNECRLSSERDLYKRPTSPTACAPVTSPKSPTPQYHVPTEGFSYRNTPKWAFMQKGFSLPSMMSLVHRSSRQRPALHQLTNTSPPNLGAGGTPRDTSGEEDEPRRLAVYPGAHEPDNRSTPPIERYDWPSPASPAVILGEMLRENRRHRSASEPDRETGENRDVESDDQDEDFSIDTSVDSQLNQNDTHSAVDRSLLSLDEEKHSGMAKAVLLSERKRRSRSHQRPLDPVSSSRTPSANREPPFKTRYDNHRFASPSRDSQHDRHESHSLGYSMEFVNLGNRAWGTAASQSLLRPGGSGGSKASSLSSASWGPGFGRAVSEDLAAHFAGYTSLVSVDESSEVDDFSRTAAAGAGQTNGGNPEQRRRNVPASGTRTRRRQDVLHSYDGPAAALIGSTPSYPSVLYASTPSALFKRPPPVPPPIFPYEMLKLTQRRLPKGVDRAALEMHLSEDDFGRVFEMSREAFYRLPEWKRNDLKRRIYLF